MPSRSSLARLLQAACLSQLALALNGIHRADICEAIARILTTDASLEEKVGQLVDGANANGGRDNISVLLAQASSGSRKRGLISRWLGQ